ncbi:UDP-N-acetylglucosamine pyrophosphorylase, putative [Plasmodium ovale]|uniref:UDP-N-acetylglucosamine diphosphorylase n=2 Tax=Plasmodium ovale TaxID=36330 RepID=A0A1A8VZF3_PLAOA|nr:UDP-N-acetylglucosamine pyrophosphorylase, putative [Plasmodium ovale curtisi]SBS96173.1 UDP-N-acetylglucosamine pyrophosphorylase, putative [Plasmodium ovale curtisi]SCP05337.1 UDP-N-acetylglucosamine pyrophosphorylase, putative [Plasmodium ovale]
MEGVLKLLKEHDQLTLHSYLEKFALDNPNNVNINDLRFFLQKLNKLKNKKGEGGNKNKGEYTLHAPPIVHMKNSIYDSEKPANGSIFTNLYENEKVINELKCIGLRTIKRSEVAVLFLAGGLGSRLGLNKAKGLLEITPLLHKTFFQFYFEQVKFLEEYCSVVDIFEGSNHLDMVSNQGKSGGSESFFMNTPDTKQDPVHMNQNGIIGHPPTGKTDFSRYLEVEESEAKCKWENCEHVKGAQGDVIIYIYIMTSDYTHDKTKKYLEENNFFGLKKENIKLFKQCNNYTTDVHFNIILATPNRFLTNPGGNGAIFKALDKHCIVQDMLKKKIKYIQIVSIDNVLNKIADPVLTGFCSFYNCDVVNKAVRKEKDESMGIFCLKEKTKKGTSYCKNTFSVCEYTELNDYIFKNPELFIYGNICHHMFSINFLQHIVNNKIYNKMNIHNIFRNKTYYDFTTSDIRRNIQTKAHVYCYEYFIFDIFKYAKIILSYEVPRDIEFNPLKNNMNGDGIQKAQKSLSNLHISWLLKNNFNIISNPQKELNFCEISPCVSYDGTFFFNLPQHKNVHLPFALTRYIP